MSYVLINSTVLIPETTTRLARIYIKEMQTVQDLYYRISKYYGIKDFDMYAHTGYIRKDQGIAILEDGEMVTIVGGKFGIDQAPEDGIPEIPESAGHSEHTAGTRESSAPLDERSSGTGASGGLSGEHTSRADTSSGPSGGRTPGAGESSAPSSGIDKSVGSSDERESRQRHISESGGPLKSGEEEKSGVESVTTKRKDKSNGKSSGHSKVVPIKKAGGSGDSAIQVSGSSKPLAVGKPSGTDASPKPGSSPRPGSSPKRDSSPKLGTANVRLCAEVKKH